MTILPITRVLISAAAMLVWSPYVSPAQRAPADRPVSRGDANSLAAHEQLLQKRTAGRIDVYFEGDSIVRRWGATDYPQLLANWTTNFHGWNAADFGWGADTTQNILWRLDNGELDGVHPKVIVLLAGTNNIGNRPPAEGADARAADVAAGVGAIVRTMRAKAPEATIVLTAIFPRNDNPAVMPVVNKTNQRLASLADGKRVRFLNINDKLADADGKLREGVMNGDKLHPAAAGYQVWADALKPILTELLGPPAAEDHAPPPTGDPKAQPRSATTQPRTPARPGLTVFNDNGAWCWFQDPRVVHDPANDTLLVCSVAATEGKDGAGRGGDVDVVSYNLKGGSASRFVLHHALLPQDDHNTAALLIRPDGRYLAMYSRHNQDAFSYWRVSARPHDATEWGPEQTFDWTPHLKGSRVTYHNLFYLPAEKRTYDFSRAVNTDPSIVVSADFGDTWAYGGKLLTNARLGYVNGYTKYASNGADRIDFVTTDHHPRDFNNNIYHGYVRGGKLYRADDTVVDDNVLDDDGHPQTELTKVFTAGTVLKDDALTHAWTVCLRRDPRGGKLFAILTARANDAPENTNFADHRLLYATLDGTAWRVHEAAKLGACLWPAEQDYTGMADLDPAHPDTLYLSTPIDPRDGKSLKVHEIFKGVTPDGGATWRWTALTADSPAANLRPVVCAWSPSDRAVLWFRGTMSRSQHYDAAVVGVLEHDEAR